MSFFPQCRSATVSMFSSRVTPQKQTPCSWWGHSCSGSGNRRTHSTDNSARVCWPLGVHYCSQAQYYHGLWQVNGRWSRRGLARVRKCGQNTKHGTLFIYGSISLLFHITFLLFFVFFSKVGRLYWIDIYKLRVIVSHFKAVKTHVMPNRRDIRELKQRQRRRQRKRQQRSRFRSAKQQLCTFITLFCTFLCRRCKYTTWNFLISRSVEDVNTRQRISISFSEFAYGA